MYKDEKRVLFSKINHPDVIEGYFDYLPTNGTYIRNDLGQVVARFHYEDRGIFYLGECEGEGFRGNIIDKVLCERISEYFSKYYGKRFTNCAAMAHFLTTGEFVECVRGDGMAILHQGMRSYSSAGRVDLGDMLCIVYGDKRIARSRKLPEIRSKFVEAQACRRQSGGFDSFIPMQDRSFSVKEIRDMCTNALADDFHFMVCVGHFRGKPVWLSQCGHLFPYTSGAAVVLTLGEHDPYQEKDLLFTLIKKRR